MIRRLLCLFGCRTALRWSYHALPGNVRLCVIDAYCPNCRRSSTATGREAFEVVREDEG